MNDTISTLGKYVIAGMVVIGDFALLYTGKVSDLSLVLLVIGWIIRDSAGTAATSNAVKTIAAASQSTTPPSVVTG